MPKGNMNIKHYSPMVDSSEVDTEQNALMIKMCLDTFHSKEPDLHNPEEVENAIIHYFDNCISKGLRPGNMGLYTTLGLTKNEVYDLIHGRNPKKANPSSIQLIKKACKILSQFREALGSQGKLNPATLIFWQKNFDGLEDVQRMEVTANNAPEASQTPEEIAAQIEQDIPVDADFTEVK